MQAIKNLCHWLQNKLLDKIIYRHHYFYLTDESFTMRTINRHEIRDRKSIEKTGLKGRAVQQRKQFRGASLDLSNKKVSLKTHDISTMEESDYLPNVSRQWASEQAKAILAVDNIRISKEHEKIAQAVTDGVMTYREAIQLIVNEAHEYAKRQ